MDKKTKVIKRKPKATPAAMEKKLTMLKEKLDNDERKLRERQAKNNGKLNYLLVLNGKVPPEEKK